MTLTLLVLVILFLIGLVTDWHSLSPHDKPFPYSCEIHHKLILESSTPSLWSKLFSPTKEHLPHPEKAHPSDAFEECDSFRYYFGLDGEDVDYSKAMTCRQNTPFASAIPIMAYANGEGVQRDLDFAITLACDDLDASPFAIQSRVDRLVEIDRSCRTNQNSKGCRSRYLYQDDITSGYATQFFRQIWVRQQRSQLLNTISSLQSGPPAPCQYAEKQPLKHWSYDYRVLGDDQIFLSNERTSLTLTVKGIGAVFQDMESRPDQLIYFNQDGHHALLPRQKPVISYEGSGGYRYLHHNFYVLDGQLIQSYAYPMMTQRGAYLLLWHVDGAKSGDALLSYHLATGELVVIGKQFSDGTFGDKLGTPTLTPAYDSLSFDWPTGEEITLTEALHTDEVIIQLSAELPSHLVYHLINKTLTACARMPTEQLNPSSDRQAVP